MADDWRRALMDKHAHLFSSIEDGRLVTRGYPAVGDGWRELLERTIERIAAAVGGEPDASVVILQIKEKFGGIRIYHQSKNASRAFDDKVTEAVDLAEARSLTTCDVCGAEGKLRDKVGWYFTRCDEHAEGAAVAGLVNARLYVNYQMRDGELCVVGRRRYDRALDLFIELPAGAGEETGS